MGSQLSASGWDVARFTARSGSRKLRLYLFPMKIHPFLLLSFYASFAAHAEVKPNSLFGDNAVLQRDMPLPVWGEAGNGEKVTVELAGQRAETIAQNGRWRVVLAPSPMGGPYAMTIRGTNTVTLNNVMLGDVWVASGQSNMERQLGPRPPQPEIDNWQQEVAAADYPLIREYYVPEVASVAPVADVHSRWTVCSPKTVRDYTAVGYFFARDLQKATRVPIGLLFSAWGGTPAEAWTSTASLKKLPDFAAIAQKMEDMAHVPSAPAKAQPDYFAAHDPGSAKGQNWAAPTLDVTNWKEAAGAAYYGPFEGIIWTRREIELPPQWAGSQAILHLGKIDENDTTFVNGVQIGATEGWEVSRNYRIPAGVLSAGRTVIAVRIVNTSGAGGMSEDAGTKFSLEISGTAGATAGPGPIPLAGNWRYQTSTAMAQLGDMPSFRSVNANTPSVLFSGMIAPLLPFPIKGVVWYQGEANNGRAAQYQTLFPAMIADWRERWGIGNFPFLFVQIAPFEGMKPEIREAQFLTLEKSPNTAMVVTADIGEARNIHPPHKAPVGARLALAARALAYHEHLEYSGPLYQSMQVEGGHITISFQHVGGGLVARGGPLKGFTIAADDGIFVPAEAAIQGATVVVSSAGVTNPSAVRYGWANVPDVNLFNQEGLPASPFRTNPASQPVGKH